MGWAHSFKTVGLYESIRLKVGPRFSTLVQVGNGRV